MDIDIEIKTEPEESAISISTSHIHKYSTLLIGGKLIPLKTLRVNLPSITADALRLKYLQSIKRSISENGVSTTPVLPFSCSMCPNKFPNPRYLNRHVRTVHYKHKFYFCVFCYRKFEEERYLDKHVKTVHENEEITKARRSVAFSCKECNLRFQTAKSLKRHFCNPGSGQTSSDNYAPTVVYTALKSQPRKKTEKRTNSTPALGVKHKHTCSVCEKAFSMKGSLEDHMRVHDKLRPFPCQFCTKRFPTKPALLVHERRHTGDRPFGCPLCTKTFVEAGEVSKHVRFHTQEKPFKCHYADCGKGFARKGHLTQHIRTHTGEKFHTCRVCLKSYPSLSNCTRHEKEVHKYFEPRELQAHVKRVPLTTDPRPRTEEEIAADIETRKRINLRKQRPSKNRKTKSKSPKIPKRKMKVCTAPAIRRTQSPLCAVRKSIRNKTPLPVDLGITVPVPITAQVHALPIPIIIKEEMLEDFTIPEVTHIKTEEEFTYSVIPDDDGTAEMAHLCPYCFKSFSSTNELEDHAICTHAEYLELRPSFNCPHLYCSEKLDSLLDLKEHQQTQHQLKAL